MDWKKFSKAIGGAVAGGVVGVPASVGVVQSIFPEGYDAPAWAYVAAYLGCVAIGTFGPYIAPANKTV